MSKPREFWIAGKSDGGFSAHELPGCGDMSAYHRSVKVREVLDNPTPSKADPLPGYIAEIKRLTSDRDELVKMLKLAESELDYYVNLDESGVRKYGATTPDLDKIRELLNRIEPKFPDVGQMEGP